MAALLKTGSLLRAAEACKVLTQIRTPTVLLLNRRVSTAPLQEHEAKPFDQIPGPEPLPVVGNILRFLPGIGEFHGLDGIVLQKRLFEKYGPMVRLSGLPGKPSMVFLYDPDHIQKVYRNEGPWPVRPGIESVVYYRNVTRASFFQSGGGILTTDGKEWQENRSKVNQPMMQPRTVKTYMGPVQDVADDFIRNIPSLRDENLEMPETFINELYKWALESIAAIALDTRLGCLDLNLAPDSEPQKLIEYTNHVLDGMYKLDIKMFPFWKLWSTPAWKKFVEANDYVTSVGAKYINEAMERMKTMQEEREPSILERLLAQNSDPRVATVMATDMIMAGIDTTSYSSATLLYHLAKNQDKQQKLFEELKRVLPSDPSQPMTSKELDSLTYLRACMKESMRIAPVAAGNARASMQDMVIGDYLIPKGTSILMCNFIMSNMDRHHPEADRFIPERWIKDQADECPVPGHKIHPFVTMPFGFGPRMCIGRRFAELEIGVLVAKIIHKFRLEYNYGEMKFKSTILYTPDLPLKFKMVDRT